MEMYCIKFPTCFFFPTKALPYVALLIAMLFFIYAVIGMQVICSSDPTHSHKCCCLRGHSIMWERLDNQGTFLCFCRFLGK